MMVFSFEEGERQDSSIPIFFSMDGEINYAADGFMPPALSASLSYILYSSQWMGLLGKVV